MLVDMHDHGMQFVRCCATSCMSECSSASLCTWQVRLPYVLVCCDRVFHKPLLVHMISETWGMGMYMYLRAAGFKHAVMGVRPVCCCCIICCPCSETNIAHSVMQCWG